MNPKQVQSRKELWRIYIKQAIQGLFTVGTSIVRRSISEGGTYNPPGQPGNGQREKVDGERGLKPLLFLSRRRTRLSQ